VKVKKHFKNKIFEVHFAGIFPIKNHYVNFITFAIKEGLHEMICIFHNNCV